MKNMKKVVSFLLAFAMVFAMNFTTAFATEAPESNNHQPASTTSGDEGIMPCVWHQFELDLPAGGSTTLSGYNVPERYIAFESTATVMGGGTNGGTYSVNLQNYGAFRAGHTKYIDGIMHKFDRIDLERTNNSCAFEIINHSGVDIHVKITFYSWN